MLVVYKDEKKKAHQRFNLTRQRSSENTKEENVDVISDCRVRALVVHDTAERRRERSQKRISL